MDERIDKCFDLTLIHPISEQNVIDLMTTAIEGGVNYWCRGFKSAKKSKELADSSKYKTLSERMGDIICRGGTVLVADDEDETGDPDDYRWHELNKVILQKGFQGFFDLRPSTGLDPGDWDAEVADMIIQMAIFGTIVYA